MPTQPSPSIGVFDSGIGGLSVLAALRELMPEKNYVYLADSGYAPYGERDTDYVLARSRICLQALLDKGCSMAVIACNTATAIAAKTLREENPLLPLVGIEPAIKPAAAHTRNGHVGVLATQGTLASEKFQALLAQIQLEHPGKQFHLHAPSGLALAIEQQDHTQIDALVIEACKALSDKACDTVVLGCTHYPLVLDKFAEALGSGVTLIDPARAVALQAQKLLPASLKNKTGQGSLNLNSTGDIKPLQSLLALL